MGMYEDLICRYPLPIREANCLAFQTKSLDCMMGKVEIREDGTLWMTDGDVWLGDGSEKPAWKQITRTLEVRFYTMVPGMPAGDHWVEFSAYFVKGNLRSIETVLAPKAWGGEQEE